MACYSQYWHDSAVFIVTRSKRNFGVGTVMVWGRFLYDEKLSICWITTKMNSSNYCELLEDVLVPYLEDYMDEPVVFQQDNDTIHFSR